MRLTTKIYIGVIALFFIIAISSFVLFGETIRNSAHAIDINPDMETITSIAGNPQIIQINYQQVESTESDDVSVSIHAPIHITLVSDTSKFAASKELLPYITTHTTGVAGDTTVIGINLDEFTKKTVGQSSRIDRIDGLCLQLPVNDKMQLTCNLEKSKIRVVGLSLSELCITSANLDIEIHDCKINKLSTQPVKKGNICCCQNYDFRNNEIDTYDLVRAKGESFSVEKTTINKLNVYGSEGCLLNLPFIKTKELNWFPSHEKQKLNVQLQDSISIKYADVK